MKNPAAPPRGWSARGRLIAAAFSARTRRSLPEHAVVEGVGPVVAGDVIEVSVEGVGTLRNPVVDE